MLSAFLVSVLCHNMYHAVNTMLSAFLVIILCHNMYSLIYVLANSVRQVLNHVGGRVNSLTSAVAVSMVKHVP